jgi:hypothetical protein
MPFPRAMLDAVWDGLVLDHGEGMVSLFASASWCQLDYHLKIASSASYVLLGDLRTCDSRFEMNTFVRL